MKKALQLQSTKQCQILDWHCSPNLDYTWVIDHSVLHQELLNQQSNKYNFVDQPYIHMVSLRIIILEHSSCQLLKAEHHPLKAMIRSHQEWAYYTHMGCVEAIVHRLVRNSFHSG